MEFDAYVRSLGLDPSTLSLEARTSLQAAWRGTLPFAETDDDARLLRGYLDRAVNGSAQTRSVPWTRCSANTSFQLS